MRKRVEQPLQRVSRLQHLKRVLCLAFQLRVMIAALDLTRSLRYLGG